ncbi:MAG: hypothetical protein MRECE_40c004 [Mycoplasmataceae bacterium CE_OT135]|nr:MAG: hypothetical protein MRECE_40c004 [Mycoplasmataceae bacterium CE_OT135]
MTTLYSVFCKNCGKDTGFATLNKQILEERGYNCSCGFSGIASEGIIKEMSKEDWAKASWEK